MKKKSLFFVLFSFLALAGCEKPEIENPAGPETTDPDPVVPSDGKTELVFNARTVDLTRTSLNGGSEVFWTEGDAISLFSEAQISDNEKFVSTGKDAATTQFTGTAKEGKKYYAIYPYAASNKITGTTATCYIPKEQELKKNSFENGAFPAVAVTETDELVFSNTAGLVSFKVPSLLGRRMTKAVLTGNADEQICGGLTVDLEKSPFEMETLSTAGTEITLTGEFTEGDVCYIAVAPVTFTQGLTLTFTDSEGATETVKQEGAAEVRAGAILTMNEFRFKPSEFYVTVNGGGTGESWGKPTTFTEALTAADEGNTIHMAAGTYQAPEGTEGYNAFTVEKNINIIGGYPENPSEEAVAAPEQNKTILSGSGNYRVMIIKAPKVEGTSVHISGLTFTEGNGFKAEAELVNDGSQVARWRTGGVAIAGSRAVLEYCTISENQAYSSPAIYNTDGAETRLDHCVVADNRSIPISEGKTSGNGAAITNTYAFLEIYNSEIYGNTTDNGCGGAIYCNMESKKPENKTITFINGCIFKDNACKQAAWSKRGGGIYSREGCETVIANSTFYMNEGGNGSAISFYGKDEAKQAYGAVISCTITGNQSNYYGALDIWEGGLKGDDRYANVGIYNTIVSGNTDVKGSPDIYITDKSEPVEGKFVDNIKCSINGTEVYGAEGTLVTEASFDFNTMFSTFANGTLSLTGTSNPAQTMGMSAAELKAIDLTRFPGFDKELLGKDQNGKARTGKVMGATVE